MIHRKIQEAIEGECPKPWPEVVTIEEVEGFPAYTDGCVLLSPTVYTSVRMLVVYRSGDVEMAPRAIITPTWHAPAKSMPIVDWLRGKDVRSILCVLHIRERNEELRITVYRPRAKDFSALERTWRRQDEVAAFTRLSRVEY